MMPSGACWAVFGVTLLGCRHHSTLEELEIRHTVAVFPESVAGGVRLSCALFLLDDQEGLQARITLGNGSGAPIEVLTADVLMGMTPLTGGGFAVVNGSDRLIKEVTDFPSLLAQALKEVPSGASATQVLWTGYEPPEGTALSPQRLSCVGRWWDDASDFGRVPPHELSTGGLWICHDRTGDAFICPPPSDPPNAP